MEAALILPILLLLVFGLIEYGWLFLKQQQINAAAREGARLAILPSTDAATLSTRISTLMSAANMGATGYTATTQPANWASASSGTTITVSISVNYANLRITAGSLVPEPPTLTATASMMKE